MDPYPWLEDERSHGCVGVFFVIETGTCGSVVIHVRMGIHQYNPCFQNFAAQTTKQAEV